MTLHDLCVIGYVKNSVTMHFLTKISVFLGQTSVYRHLPSVAWKFPNNALWDAIICPRWTRVLQSLIYKQSVFTIFDNVLQKYIN